MKGRILAVNQRNGHFGKFGGSFVPEQLIAPLAEISTGYERFKNDENFVSEFNAILRELSGRPTNLYFAKKLSEELKGAKIYLKREDQNYTGSYCFNSAAGHLLLAKYLGKKKVITATGNGNQGYAAALLASRLGLECQIYVGEHDLIWHETKISTMKYLGAEITAVPGNLTLAISAAVNAWSQKYEECYYAPTGAIGPAPWPEITRDLQAVIGAETYRQFFEKEGRQPDQLIAAAKTGSAALGFFYPFLKFKEILFTAVELAGSAVLSGGKPGLWLGSYTYIRAEEGKPSEPNLTISSNNIPAAGPEISYLKEIQRINCVTANLDETKKALKTLAQTEGILCALESAPAIAQVIKTAPELTKDKIIIACLTGSAAPHDIAVATNKLRKEE